MSKPTDKEKEAVLAMTLSRVSEVFKIAIRAGQIAYRILGLMETGGKLHAQLVMHATIEMLKELSDKIDAIKEDGA